MVCLKYLKRWTDQRNAWYDLFTGSKDACYLFHKSYSHYNWLKLGFERIQIGAIKSIRAYWYKTLFGQAVGRLNDY